MNIVDRLSRSKLAIFLFHGVVENSDYRVRNYTRKHLTRDVFYAHMKALKAAGQALSMNDVVDHVTRRKPFPPGAFSVTFDDGFENNYSVARLVLEELKIPATIYVTTCFIEDNAMSWIDRVEYCFEITTAKTIKMPWQCADSAIATPAEQRAVLDDIRLHVKRDASIDIEAFVNDVFGQCGVEEVAASRDPLDLKMSWEQIRDLGRNPNFIIGGHTHTHRIMSHMPPEILNKEVDMSLKLLEEKGGVVRRHYSYPEGLSHCYSPAVIECLKSRGIVCSPTAQDGLNGPEEDLFDLKRILVTS